MAGTSASRRIDAVMSAARGQWRRVLTEAGVEARLLDGKPHPCPVCGGRDRFVFDDKYGRGDSFCRHCGHATGLDLLCAFRGLTFMQGLECAEKMLGIESPRRPEPEERPVAQDSKTVRERRDVLELWSQARPIESGDPVWRYLAGRGIDPGLAGYEIRYHSRVPHASSDPKSPAFAAMLARVWDADGQIVNLHRTFLTEDGRKAPVNPVKKLMPGPFKGAAVHIGPVPARVLGLAEGIETALACYQQCGFSVWATLGCVNLESFVKVPESVEKVVIFGDNDAKFAGQKAAYALAHQLAVRGLEVEVRIPPETGTDWLDVFTRQTV
ncbi:MAG: toprim domain-containing protein [Duodenibacillus sp.]